MHVLAVAVAPVLGYEFARAPAAFSFEIFEVCAYTGVIICSLSLVRARLLVAF
jgi:hypothetical protein